MKVINIHSTSDISEECFKQMKGKKFVAISLETIEGREKWRIHQNMMTDEQMIYGLNLAINQIINEQV